MAVQEFVYGTLLLETERTAAHLLNSGGPLPLGRRQVGKTFPHGHKPGGFLSGGAARAPCQTVSWFISRTPNRPAPCRGLRGL